MRSRTPRRELETAVRRAASSDAGAALDGRPPSRAAVFMDTVVSVEVVDPVSQREFDEHVDHVFRWFGEVEATCSRFRPDSEISRLARQPGTPVALSPLVFEALRFALAMADVTDGAFDPTVGAAVEAAGFNREHRTGTRVTSGVVASDEVSYRDIQLDPATLTVTCARPLLIDLGAVAKGFAVDLGARALSAFSNFAINAGGDVFVSGHNGDGSAWQIGVRDPREPDALAAVLSVSGAAVCTSGGYERPRPNGDGHHIVDPRTGESPREVLGVTVIAPTTMLADALATAVFVLGPDRAITFLEEQGAEGLVLFASGRRATTSGFAEYQR